MAGEYDFRLGANSGLFSSMVTQQRAQALIAYAAQSPLVQGAMERQWEVAKEYLNSIGYPDPERFIGPVEAVSQGTPKPQDEENMDMAQYLYGDGVPSPVHPSDDDEDHLMKQQAFLQSDEFRQMGRPNFRAYAAHGMRHQQAIQNKQMMQTQQSQMAVGQPPQGQPGQQQAPQNARNVAQLEGAGQAGQMGQIPPQNAPPSGSMPGGS